MSAINAAARGRGFDMSLHTHSHGHMHTLSHPHTHDERPKTPPPQEHHFQPQPLRQVMQPPPLDAEDYAAGAEGDAGGDVRVGGAVVAGVAVGGHCASPMARRSDLDVHAGCSARPEMA